MKVAKLFGRYIIYHCVGCNQKHLIPVLPKTAIDQPSPWQWNGSLEKPTLSPSILQHPAGDIPRCHHYLKEGKIQFLSDCDHEYAGQTVELTEIRENEESM